MSEEGGFFAWIRGWFWSTGENEEVAPDPSTRQRDKAVDKLLAKYPSESFPFENIAFEGGGMKGLAHAGALRVLEEAGIAGRIKRVVGTSSGAMTAALFAIGYDSYQLEKFLRENMSAIMNDHRFGKASFLPNVITSYGWNSGDRFTDWFGDKLKDRTGKADITFYEVYERYGCQLCVCTTNVNEMMTEYCHPKTTPDMSVLQAVRMSMSLPILFSPVTGYRGSTIVDGGLLCNYPIHCYDGWWLSMEPEDEFLKKLQPLGARPDLVLDDGERFGTYNDKTIGFLVYANDDVDLFRRTLHERILKYSTNVQIPDTKLSRHYVDHCEKRDALSTTHAQLYEAAGKFLKAMHAEGLNQKEQITKEDLEHVLSKGKMANEDLKILFEGQISADDIFAKLKRKNEDWFGYRRFVTYLQQQGFDILSGYMARHKTAKINGFRGYLSALFNTASMVAQKHVKQQDVERTVGITTEYIGTTDFKLEAADKTFIVEQGRRSVIAYLRFYAHRFIRVKEEPKKVEQRSGWAAKFMPKRAGPPKVRSEPAGPPKVRSEPTGPPKVKRKHKPAGKKHVEHAGPPKDDRADPPDVERADAPGVERADPTTVVAIDDVTVVPDSNEMMSDEAPTSTWLTLQLMGGK